MTREGPAAPADAPTGSPADTDGLRGRMVSAVAWTAVEKWSGRLLSFAVFALLTRLLDPANFGLFSLASAVVAVLSVFVDSGFSKAIVQRASLSRVDTSTTFWSSVVLSVVIYLLVLVTAVPLGTLLGDPALAPVLRVAGLVVPLSALSRTTAALLERELRFRPLAVRQLIGNVAGAAVAVPLALHGAGVWTLVGQVLVAALVSTVLLWLLTDWRPSWEFSRDSLRSMLSFGVHTLGIDLLAALQANLDKIVVGALFDARTLGYYFVAQRATGVVLELATSVLGRVSLSVMSRVQSDRERLNRALRQLTLASSVVALPTFAMLAVFADDLLPLLVGDGWSRSVPLFQVLTLSSALAAVMFFDVNALTAVGRPAVALRLSILLNVVGVGLVLLAAPLGTVAVAWSRSLRLLVLWPARLWALRRYAGIDVTRYVGLVGRVVVGLVPAVALALALARLPWGPAHGVAWTLAVAAVSTVVYLASTWWVLGRADRAALRAFVASLRRRPSRVTAPAS